MESTSVKAAALKKTEDQVSTVLVHKTQLLRLKNWLCSPLLRLPTETIVHILSYIMEAVEHPSVWRPVFSTCYRIHTIMCTTTELWRKANFQLDRTAHLAFARSMGNLQEIIVDFQGWDDWQEGWIQNALDFCRESLVLRGHSLRTVDLSGFPSDMVHWSWIFERSLPRLHRLKIHFFPPEHRWTGYSSLSHPVALQLPTDLPLQVLDLFNATLPWSSNLFIGLRELYVGFKDCDAFVEISGDELLGILDASPRLERLSLVDLMTPLIPAINLPQFTPTRVVQLPNLTFLRLDNFIQSIGYILAHVNIPAISFFEIRTQLAFWEIEWSLNVLFPDDRLPNRLFPNPPVFEIWPSSGEGIYDSLMVNIGSAKMQFDFDVQEIEPSCTAMMTYIHPLVPSSVTTLRLDHSRLDEGEWVEFFSSHPEVQSIECSASAWDPVSESLWGALSPAGPGVVPLCPKLKSISVFKNQGSMPLSDCLRNRKNAGFGLKHLKLWGAYGELVEEFSPLVEELQVLTKPVKPVKKARLVSTNRLDV